MVKGKTCEYCGDALVYDEDLDKWACENCEDVPFKKYSSKYLSKITQTKPYQFFFGPKDFDLVTRKASKRLWRGVKSVLLGVGLLTAFLKFFYLDANQTLVCCLIWALLIIPLGLLYLVRALRYFRKLKPVEDPDRSKGYRWSLHWIFPNYLVAVCIFMFCFLAFIDIYTLGRIDEGNVLVDILRGDLGLAGFLDSQPYLVPVILWYFATRSMTHSYREAFEAGHRLSIRRHDAKLLREQKVDKWYKKALVIFSQGIGYVAMFKTVVYTSISVLIFVLNQFLFHQEKRQDFMFGLFSGYRIVIFQICFLLLIFIAMSWVTDYIIARNYPTTVFSSFGKLSLKIKDAGDGKKKKNGSKKGRKISGSAKRHDAKPRGSKDKTPGKDSKKK